jgi:hypothetical protein
LINASLLTTFRERILFPLKVQKADITPQLKRKVKALLMVAFVVDIDPSIDLSIKASKIQGMPKTASTSKPAREF